MVKILRFLLISSILLSFVHAQGRIVGRVYDAVSGKGLPLANVLIQGTKIGTSCDLEGNYVIPRVPPGEYTLVASMVGYKPQSVKVIIRGNETREVNFYLNEEIFKVEEIVAIGEKPAIEKEVSSSKAVIKREILEIIPTEDVKGVLEKQAGFQGQGSDIHVRGGRSNEVMVLIDGLPIKDVLSGSAFGLYIPSTAIEELEALTGGFNAEYGQAMSGVVNISLREGASRFTGSVDYVRDNFGRFNDILRVKNSQNKDVLNVSLSGPEPISYALRNLLKINIPGNITYYVSFHSSLEDTHLPHADSLYSSVYKTWKLSPREENDYSLLSRVSWKVSNNFRLYFMVNKSLEINQGYFMSSSDYPFAHGFPYHYINNLQNYLTFTRDAIQQAISISHALSLRSFYDLKISRFFTNLRADVNGKHWSEYVETVDTVPKDLFWDYGDAPYWHDHYVETWTGKFDFTHIFSKIWKMKTGFIVNRNELQWLDIHFPWYGTQSGLGLNYDLYKIYSFDGGIYVQTEIAFAGMIANLGIRGDFWVPGKYVDDAVRRILQEPNLSPAIYSEYNSYLNDNATIRGRIVKFHISPRLGFAYPITENTKFFASYGHFSQIPDLKYVYSKLGVRASSSYELVGNPNLRPTVTVAYEIGVEQLLNQRSKLKVTAYYKDVFNYPTARKVPGIPPNPSFWMYFNSDYSRSVGLEADLTYYTPYHVYGSISLTLSQSKGRSSSAEDWYWRGSVETLKEWYLKWDRPVKFYGDIAYSLKKGEYIRFSRFKIDDLLISAGLSLQSGVRYTPQDTLGNIGEINSKLGPMWKRADLKFEKGLFRAGKMDFRFKSEIRNVFNWRNHRIINPVTGRAYEPGDPLPPRTTPESMLNPARYSEPREIFVGVLIRW
ncbi:MAG: TonB-dependent receptor [bacterium]|nr:TonB-dependent receptor [bacterium]